MSQKGRLPIFRSTSSPWFRAGIIVFLIVAAAIMVASSQLLTLRFSERLRAESQLSGALYSGNMVTLLRRQQLVPLLLARDPVLITALQSNDYTNTSQRLIEISEDISVGPISLLDGEGRVVAASDRRELITQASEQPYFTAAMREPFTIFTLSSAEDGGAIRFHYAQRVVSNAETIGVVVIELDLRPIENSWRNRNHIVAVTDASDRVILASNPEWRNNTLTNVVTNRPPPSNWRTVFSTNRVSAEDDPLVYIDGQPLLRSEVKTGFRGWRLNYFETLGSVRSQVNGVLALMALAMALLMALILFVANKRLERQSRLIAAESDQLRLLNARLSAEIEERERVERNLEEAEQSLEQASKLAAIGQMSAAVSHELNQPLAAMRTYLAGARLLLQRNRVDEALTSFHRIDDLIGRMGTITRQMKSYARKGADALAEVDLRDAVDGSLAMMSPQLGQTRVEVRRNLPREPVMVRADPVRLDQIIVNLLRNAVDACADEKHPVIDILVVQGRQITLSVRDNGHGIDDPEQLFEPFYTTKKAGEGVGLGLAISAGIAKELGGRLTARNASPQGAVFELRLPRADDARAHRPVLADQKTPPQAAE